MTRDSPGDAAADLLDGLVGHGIIGLDAGGRVVRWSLGAHRLEGWTAEEAVGRAFADGFLDDARASDAPARLLREALDHGVHEEEGWRRRKDGSTYWAEAVVTPLPGGAGGFGVVLRDHTRRQTAREAEAAAREGLQAQRLQSQRLETVGQLAGGIAHDFNNLLAGIISYADLASGALAQELTERGLLGEAAFVQIAGDVEEISVVAGRAAALTRQLLIFSRREVVRPSVVDINSVVGEVGSLLRRTIGEGVLVDVDTARHVPHVLADRGQIEQICMNLAVNARDAMRPNGGRLRIETATVELHEPLRTLAPGRYASLAVRDNGEGMSAEVADRAFEPFFTTKPRGSGSGLGLATVYGIARGGGGDVSIDSELGRGTVVTVLLPETDQPLAAEDDTWVRRPPVGRGETVLLVEDEVTVRESARRLLARNHYRVVAAGDADQALDLAQGHDGPIDLLLTDVVMPGRSGKELATELLARRPGLRVVYMSGYSEDVIAHQGVLDEGVTMMQKPFTAAALLRTVRAAIDGGDRPEGR